jgi:hypothetical protein
MVQNREGGMGMTGFLNQTRMSIQDRLRLHKGFSVSLQAKDFNGDPVLLQSVGRQFFKVAGQYFVPTTLNQITLLGFQPQLHGVSATVRSTYRGTFQAQLIRTGSDFVELLIAKGREWEWALIPLERIVSLEQSQP